VFPTQPHEPGHTLEEHLRRRVEGHALHMRQGSLEHRDELPDRTLPSPSLPSLEPFLLAEAEERLSLLLEAEDRQHLLTTFEAQGEELQLA